MSSLQNNDGVNRFFREKVINFTSISILLLASFGGFYAVMYYFFPNFTPLENIISFLAFAIIFYITSNYYLMNYLLFKIIALISFESLPFLCIILMYTTNPDNIFLMYTTNPYSVVHLLLIIAMTISAFSVISTLLYLSSVIQITNNTIEKISNKLNNLLDIFQ